jgi:isoleucyl-tRNA synthetase
VTIVGTDPRFRLLPADRPPNELEEEVLTQWRDEDLFARTLAARADGPPFVFFEGPPTANGRPGIHHVFSRTIKDLFCRHRAMRGHYVPRKAGWDTHGLPVEIEVEKALAAKLIAERGMSEEDVARASGKQLIEAYGVEAFNQLCRESVWKYRGDWERLSERVGYWLDYEHPYVTYTNDYVESVWWALKTLHDRGYLYRGHKILPYCARCGTALASHEVALGYQDDEDPSVYVALEIEAPDGESGIGNRESAPGLRTASTASRTAMRILVWTTTPWTLVSNVALAVHPELVYVELARRKGEGGTIVLAEARAGAVLGDDYTDRWALVRRWTGAELAGMRYRRPLDWVSFDGVAGDHEVIVAESFVSAEDGTGVVHMAPAFGADDFAAGRRHGLAFLQPVSARGEFPADMPLIGGLFVKAADPLIIEELQRRGALWKAGTLVHPYPHCWRCGTPLIYYARGSWFVRTTAYRDQMLARNARVDWHPPAIGEKRFGEWLFNNIDWAISRDRYWGTPLPVWVCEANAEHVEAIGSFAELAARVGPLPNEFDPHKPYVDRWEWACEQCRALGVGSRESAAQAAPMMRRVPEVIDTWFDSGSMSFAQWHYPHAPGSREKLERQYPADFIAEGVDQTRGWFYSLLAIATGLGDALPNNSGAWERGSEDGESRIGNRESGIEPEPASREPRSAIRDTAPYRAVVVNDLVLDADGVKMSKRLGNIVEPLEVVSRHGADAVRLFLVSSSQLDVPRRFDEAAIRETVGRFLLTFRNVYSGMFATLANFGWSPSPEDPVPMDRPHIDRWILSRTTTVEQQVDADLERYDATAAARRIMTFVVDDVSNWYVRLSRSRFYEVDAEDNRAAFATLREVLIVTCRLLAPLAPFVSDWVHRELTGESVHLAPYRRPDPPVRDQALERAMDDVRLLSKLGRAAREEAGVKVRQPLSRLVCVAPLTHVVAIGPLLPLLAAELNVKSIKLASSSDDIVTLEAKPNFRGLGKKFGKNTPLAAKAIAGLGNEALRAFEHGEPLALSVGNESRLLDHEDLTIVRRATGDLLVKEEDGRFAAIDPAVTPELRQEGLAREFVSRVQRLRKESGLAVSDRIRVLVTGNQEIDEAIRVYHEWIAAELLAREIVIGGFEASAYHATQTMDIDGILVRVAFTKEA